MAFKRLSKTTAQDDVKGTIKVVVYRLVPGTSKYAKGALMRSVSIEDTKVSTVFAAIERALFG